MMRGERERRTCKFDTVAALGAMKKLGKWISISLPAVALPAKANPTSTMVCEDLILRCPSYPSQLNLSFVSSQAGDRSFRSPACILFFLFKTPSLDNFNPIPYSLTHWFALLSFSSAIQSIKTTSATAVESATNPRMIYSI